MDQRNLILAIALSVLIILSFQWMFPAPVPETGPTAPEQAGQAGETIPGQPDTPVIPGTVAADGDDSVSTSRSREAVLADSPRVAIDTPSVRGSINLVGGRIDDLVLHKYRETLEEDSPNIILLSPAGSKDPYLTNFGWISAASGITVPDNATLWTADGSVLAPGRPLTLSWDNGQGFTFQKTFSVDENYLFTMTQRVANNSDAPASFSTYGLVSRTGTPDVLGFYILHEGPIGVTGESLKLEEYDYEDLQDEGRIEEPSTGGWIGITDKYWMTVLIPEQTEEVTTTFHDTSRGGPDKYQADFVYHSREVASGATVESTSRLFAGAKKALLIDEYAEEFNIELFDRSIDFGWFYWLTKPIFYALNWLFGVTGNFGVAILILTIGIKIIFFPLANKSHRSMAKMKLLQPKTKEIQERFKDDKQRLQQEMMALYKKEGANPMAGCLPILIQIPVFFALYKVMFVTIEMRHAPFFGWIKDLSAPDPTSILNLFGLLPYDIPELGIFQIISLGIWPILMGLTMFLQQQLNPQPPDPVQAKIFLFMPIIFTFLLATFPAGLVIYWTWNNLLTILQQVIIMKQMGTPIGRGKAAASSSNTSDGPTD